MNMSLVSLEVLTRESAEHVAFAPTVSFFYGRVGTGKSSIARLVDYCLGGRLERTPALRQEFISVQLRLQLGNHRVVLERGANETSSVRATWHADEHELGSVTAPFDAETEPIVGANVFNLSDLLFYLWGVEPIKVRRSKLNPDSPVVRLSFRDMMWYCYLEQDHLDSSFYRMEDVFKRLKSRDVMRFVTGLHSERMSELEEDLFAATDGRKTRLQAIQQIREFMDRFNIGSEMEMVAAIHDAEENIRLATDLRDRLERDQASDTHAVEPLRDELRLMSQRISDTNESLAELTERIAETSAMRAELVAARVKSLRLEQAGQLLDAAKFAQCPECGTHVAARDAAPADACILCKEVPVRPETQAKNLETLRREIDERLDDMRDSAARHKREQVKMSKALVALQHEKTLLDRRLAHELASYDSAYVSLVREADRRLATWQERREALQRLREMPKALGDLQREADSLGTRADDLRKALEIERANMGQADVRIRRIADEMLRIMRAVEFPGVYSNDSIRLDSKTWYPHVRHGDIEWSFHDAGSGGKKTLFNVCYALAVHAIAAAEGLPLPPLLILDSPTKNISKDEDPRLVQLLYREIYALSARIHGAVQFVLIDSDLVPPEGKVDGFAERHMAGTPDAPALISYYQGP
jgi:phage host-nuclease inhibitor protein Gam